MTTLDQPMIAEMPMSSTKVRELMPEDLPPVQLPMCASERKVLKGQVAIVTGASSGIGRAVAIALGHAGAHVVVNYVKGDDDARAVADTAMNCGCGGTGHHTKAIAVKADVSDEEQVRAMFERTFAEFGTVDILVNNAGLQQDASIEHMTLAQWRKVIDVNLTGQFLCAREAIREFKRRGIRPDVSCAAGKILCMSSVHDVIPWAGHVNYAASKGGVMLMMKSIAQEVAPYRIRVNSICPGAIRTPINRPAWETPEAYRELLKLIPYKRIGEPEDIARAAVWLASDESDYLTGTNLYVDGGMTLYPGFETGG
ncbi:MAG: SDR family oxidoreductase [Tepidisphaeraceae bacterium]